MRPIIKDFEVNNKRRVITITISRRKGSLDLPFYRLRLKPSKENPIEEIFIDEELGKESITYSLGNGKEDSVHLDAFLDFNNDHDHLLKLKKYLLTDKINQHLDENPDITISNLSQFMKTSRAQIHRLLDTANTTKSLDELYRLCHFLGIDPDEEQNKKVA